ncbi:MAG: tetratricopeptide repeat protein [Polyangiales bacterium]
MLFVVAACGPRITQENMERSFREYELARGLREEGNTPAALEHLRTSLDLNPQNAEAYLLLGWIQYERANFPVAEQNLRRGVDLLVEQDRLGSTLAEARNLLGVTLVERGRYTEAIEILRKSALDEMNTAPHLAWGNLGLAQQRAGDDAAALESFQEAVRLQPRFCIGWFRMGAVYADRNDYERAEQALTRALDADPTCREAPQLQGAWRLRGEARAHLGFREEAVTDFERCIELGPGTPDGIGCQALLDGAP